ncbi:hypothetical protein P2318_31210 [Myxococcaceae bacterium GXIMD 01537]
MSLFSPFHGRGRHSRRHRAFKRRAAMHKAGYAAGHWRARAQSLLQSPLGRLLLSSLATYVARRFMGRRRIGYSYT